MKHPDAPDAENDIDAGLMARTQEGDLRAFEEIVRRHEKVLVNFFARGGVHIDAEDLAQKTFLRLYNYRDRYRPTAKVRTFLFLLARQVYVDELRRLERMGRLQAAAQAEAQESYTGTDEVRLDVARALSILPAGLRDVIVMAFLEGAAYEEIGERLGIPVGTVKSRVFNALRRMRKFFEEDER